MDLPRRAVVLFVPPPVEALVDDLRHRWDPVMAARIDAHVTLVHDVVDHEAADRLIEAVAVEQGPITITLRTANCWSRAAYGVYLDVDDPSGAVAALHDRFASLESPDWARAPFRPHVTLVHGRTVAPELAEPAWEALCGLDAGWHVELAAIDVIELDEATGWRSVLRAPFAATAVAD